MTEIPKDNGKENISNNIKFNNVLDIIEYYKSKDIIIISKSFEQNIENILSFLLDSNNLAIDKIIIVKFLQFFFLKNEMNSEIFSRVYKSKDNNCSIYKIIIHEYIVYKNYSNDEEDEISYRRELLVLFDILLTQITFDRESYYYILSFMRDYFNEKNNNISFLSEFHLNSEYLNRILILLKKFYYPYDSSKFYGNYFFFSGESESSIIIKNKMSNKDSKKLLNFDDTLCIFLIFKVFPSEYIKSLNDKVNCSILHLKFIEKSRINELSFNIDEENNIKFSCSDSFICKLSENEINYLLIKFNKKKLQIKLYLNGKKIFKKSNLHHLKMEIKEIILFKNFIGFCYNFMLFKNKYPKFIKNELKSLIDSNYKKEISSKNSKNKESIYYKGFNNEEMILPFIKMELKDIIEQNNIKNLFNEEELYLIINNNDYKDFMEKTISIYIPSRVNISNSYEQSNIMNNPNLIIEDSINELNAEFYTNSPHFNGVHIFKKIKDDFKSIGGLNNILPIMELMVNNDELLNKNNLEKFFDILISIFSPYYKNALIKEKDNNFFLFLSYFIEKIPSNFFDNSITNIFKKISYFFAENINEENYFLNQQYQNHILMNEQILFKFHYKEQNEIIESMSHFLQNIDAGKEKFLSIDIFKIIKILIHLDADKNKLFCCKNHANFFIENNKVMEPELYIRLHPIKGLLTHLFKEFKKYVDDRNNSAEEAGKSLFKIMTILSSDISPCLQKMILNLFTECLKENFNLYIEFLDKENEFLNICLFVYKNTIFDVKEDALNLILLYLYNQQKIGIDIDEDIFQFMTNYILPYFLFQDEEIIQSTFSETISRKIKETNDNNSKEIEKDNQEDNLQNNLIIDNISNSEQNDKTEGNKESESIQNEIFDEIYGDEKSDNSNDKPKKIKIRGVINDIKYSLPLFNVNLKHIYLIYNKTKLKVLINNLYKFVIKFFNEGILTKLCLSLLIKIVSKGNILLILFFIESLNSAFLNNSNKEFENELNNNNLLLQWLIETNFQAKLILDSNLDENEFVPGFDLNANKIENGFEISLNNKEKLEILKKIMNISEQILLKVLLKNIFKLDYLYTWSKYFYELRNEKNNFKSVRNLIYSFLPEIAYTYMNDMTEFEKFSLNQKRMSIYLFDLLFEFVTFYKLKQEDLDKFQDENSLYKELSMNLKYILVSKIDDIRDYSLRPTDVQENINNKFDEYPLTKSVFDKCTPLWKRNNKDNRNENEIYQKFIKNKTNENIKELEILMYNFSDLKEFTEGKNKNLYVNKGIPLIILFYHFFIFILSIGGAETELSDILYNFRLFILLLIISSSTLCPFGSTKKKKWPSEEEYNQVQIIIESIFFNFIYFFINKIKKTKDKISLYNESSKELDSNDKKYLHYLKQTYALFIENLGFFLKILNIIYKEKKKEAMSNKASFNSFVSGITSLFKDSSETKKAGGYKLMEKIYADCESLLNNNNDEHNLLDKISEIKYDIFFTKKNKEKEMNNEQIESFKKLEENISNLLERAEFLYFFEKHEDEYKKVLFPFISYISSRRDAVKNIIPIYDNRPNLSSYPKDYFLVPDYIPESILDSFLMTSINPVNTQLSKSINLDLKTWHLEQQYKSHNYKKEKERLFSFRGIWSTKEFFYSKKKYKLKYRLINHLNQDLTRVLLTPIIDVNYYLPCFSRFNDKELFRDLSYYKQINKVTDLSFDIKKKFPILETPNKKGKNHSSNINIEQITFGENKKDVNLIELDIKEPEKEEKEKNALYYLGEEMFRFLTIEKRNDIHNYLFFEYIHKKHSVEGPNCLQTTACLVRISLHIRGFIFNNSKGIGFYSFESIRKENEIEDFDEDRKVCFGSVFEPQTHKYNNFYLWIPYNKIQMVFKRRYYFKIQAIEIFTEDRKSYLFKLNDTVTKFFFDNIKFFMKQDIEEIHIEYNKFEEKIGFMNKNNIFLNYNLNYFPNEKKLVNLKNIYEKWCKWEISTLKLLMILNIYANRSYNDINQYPVFPWIITDYTSKTFPNFDEKNIRPMEKPMGMLDFTDESKERKENYEMHWMSNENDPDKDENYDRYGSHYSTSLYLTYYLVRVFPFSYIRIELQGKKFDDPNRLFNSLSNSFECAITQKSDLRELIPEFFCFPEMFLNINELNLGEIYETKTKKKLVEGVEMPLWAENNAYIFIEKHRELLESGEINEKINEWFNIIFGSKQKGKEGKKIKNLFIKQTYEDFEENYSKGSKLDKIYHCRMVEFGVTPNQIFKNDTCKRQNLYDNNRIKHSLLFNVFQKIKKNQKITGKEIELEEIKFSCKENVEKFFVFIVKKKEKKKERLFLLSKNRIDIFTKKDRMPLSLFKSAAKLDDKESQKKNNDKIDYNFLDIFEENENFEEEETPQDNLSLNKVISLKLASEKDIENKIKSKIYLRFKHYKNITLPKYRINSINPPTILYNEGSIAVFGGFWNGDIFIKQIKEGQKLKGKKINIMNTGELYPVTKIIIDKTETFAICVNSEGAIFIYIIDIKEKLVWELHNKIDEGQGEVSSLEINENLGIFIICFKNGYCMVYTLPKCKLINSFIIEEEDLNNNINSKNKDNNEINGETSINNYNLIYSPHKLFISSSPLPCFTFYIEERKSLCVYSINAQLLNECKLGYPIVNNGIIKYTDYSYRDFLLIYNPINNSIDIHQLIDLNIIISSPFVDYQFIDFHFSSAFDYVYILTNDKGNNKMFILKQSDINSKKLSLEK